MFKLAKIGQAAFKIAIIVFLPFFYLFLFRLFGTFLSIVVLLWILGSIGFTIYAFVSEKKRLFLRNEFFKNDNLFFRYGEEVFYRAIPIPVKDDWSAEESGKFGYKIIDRIQDSFINSYGSNPLNGSQVVTIIGATDRERPSDSRGFLKISFAGTRGAIFSRFITFQVLGKNVVIHMLAYLLGMPKLLDIIYFVITSPFYILTWFFRWLRDEYSIYAALAKEIDNSFEIIDMEAYFVSTKKNIADCINEELKVQGLYTEKLAQIVNNTFNNANINFGNQSFGQSVNNYGANYGNMATEIK
ncbi:MAG: hypothetical protein J0M29_10085 [Chitinophagales bacterium]|nr:hypothetical protein [Chitinophagales bacterium]